jgi:hypothetical protein
MSCGGKKEKIRRRAELALKVVHAVSQTSISFLRSGFSPAEFASAEMYTFSFRICQETERLL